jgi:hypothetical protein
MIEMPTGVVAHRMKPPTLGEATIDWAARAGNGRRWWLVKAFDKDHAREVVAGTARHAGYVIARSE